MALGFCTTEDPLEFLASNISNTKQYNLSLDDCPSVS